VFMLNLVVAMTQAFAGSMPGSRWRQVHRLAAQRCARRSGVFATGGISVATAYFTSSGQRREQGCPTLGPRSSHEHEPVEPQGAGRAMGRYEIVERQAAVIRELFRRDVEEHDSIGSLGRWASSRELPSAIGKGVWDRSVICGIVRNPAYCGRAAFAKTRRCEQRPCVNRVLRLQGQRLVRGAAPRAAGTRAGAMDRDPGAGHYLGTDLRACSPAAAGSVGRMPYEKPRKSVS